jgi:hypothetical protein
MTRISHVSGINRQKVAMLLSVHKAARAAKKTVGGGLTLLELASLGPRFSSVISVCSRSIRSRYAARGVALSPVGQATLGLAEAGAATA